MITASIQHASLLEPSRKLIRLIPNIKTQTQVQSQWQVHNPIFRITLLPIPAKLRKTLLILAHLLHPHLAQTPLNGCISNTAHPVAVVTHGYQIDAVFENLMHLL
jgi:hypothetical protein